MLSDIEWVIIDLILFNILAFSPLFKIKITNSLVAISKTNNYTNYCLLICGILIYSVCDRTGGDYFHYREIVDSIYSKNYWGTHLELPYVFLANHIGFSYELWRLIVWGAALYFYLKIIEEFKFYKFLSIWIFILIGLTDFSIVRSSLAITILIYGTILIKKKHNLILGFIFIIISFFLHKSIIILIPYLILLKITINKKTLIIIIFSLGLIKYLISNHTGLLLLLMDNDNNSADYLTDSENSLGLAYLIQQFLFWAPSVLLITKGLKQKLYKSSNLIGLEYNLVFYLLIIYIILGFFPINMTVFKDRIIWMMSIPICLIVTNLLNKKLTVQTFSILLIYIVYNNYKLLYMLYLKKLGLGI